MKPTPGTWRCEGWRILSDHLMDGETRMPVADLCLAFKDAEEMHANGLLIASAPALLAALCRLDAYIDFSTPTEVGSPIEMVGSEGLNEALVQAHEAIARATGAER